MNWTSIDDIIADFEHKGEAVMDALYHVAKGHLNGLTVREMGHLINVVHEEWHPLSRFVMAEQYQEALAHAKTKFIGRARGNQWPYTVSALMLAYLLDAHKGEKPRR